MPRLPATPRQLIKSVYGLRGAYPMEPTDTRDDAQLMAMDAPEFLPAGSTLTSPDFSGRSCLRERLTIRPYFRSQP